MQTDRPLDALVPELAASRRAPMPRTPIHQRVLEVGEADGFSWHLAVFVDPGAQRELHRQALALIEATLLAELSGTPARVADRATPRRPAGIVLHELTALPYDAAPALRAFAMAPTPVPDDDESWAVWQAEARAVGAVIAPRPLRSWRAGFAHPQGALREKLDRIELAMAQQLGSDVWGNTPGVPSHLLATWLKQEFGEEIRPTPDGLRAAEFLLAPREPGAIRWMGPMLFQALCDLIGVIAQSEYGCAVEWAVCAEERSGHAPPPVFRIQPKRGARYHLPIAHHVLRWSMMPVEAGEDVPALADWLPGQFGEG